MSDKVFKTIYKTPSNFDDLVLESDGSFLINVHFKEDDEVEINDLNKEIFIEAFNWLDLYFKNEIPNFIPKYKLINLTTFQNEVLNIVKEIPYGETLTYKDVASLIEKKRGIKKMSAQAIGGALNKNPICLSIPCHRVIGSNNELVGYKGGLNNKKALLELEKNNKK